MKFEPTKGCSLQFNAFGFESTEVASAKRCCGNKYIFSVSPSIFEHPNTDIENDDDDCQFTDTILTGPTGGDCRIDQGHGNEDMAIEYGLPGEVIREKEIIQYSADYDSNKEAYISGVEECILRQG